MPHLPRFTLLVLVLLVGTAHAEKPEPYFSCDSNMGEADPRYSSEVDLCALNVSDQPYAKLKIFYTIGRHSGSFKPAVELVNRDTSPQLLFDVGEIRRAAKRWNVPPDAKITIMARVYYLNGGTVDAHANTYTAGSYRK